VPEASLQVENGVTSTSQVHATLLSICQSLVRLGVGHSTEIRIGLPSYAQSFSGGAGATDISVGLKRQLGPLAGFDVSLIVAASLPTGTSTQTSHRVDPFVKVPWSHDLGEGWSIGGMSSFFWPTENGRRNMTWEPTLVLEREFSQSTYAFAEYGGDYPQHGGTRQTAHFGIAYKIGLKNQIDFHTGFGLTPSTPRRFFAVGYSFRIDNLWTN
jgi:hypothetical protein